MRYRVLNGGRGRYSYGQHQSGWLERDWGEQELGTANIKNSVRHSKMARDGSTDLDGRPRSGTDTD